MGALTEDEAIEVLWSAKSMYQVDERGEFVKGEGGRLIPNPKWCDAFVYATLRRDATMRLQDGPHRVARSGARVLVTMVSRFGDVGIRDDRLVPASNGYYCRVQPADLADWGTEP